MARLALFFKQGVYKARSIWGGGPSFGIAVCSRDKGGSPPVRIVLVKDDLLGRLSKALDVLHV